MALEQSWGGCWAVDWAGEGIQVEKGAEKLKDDGAKKVGPV